MPTNPLSPVPGETADDVRLKYIAVQQDTIQKGVENIAANMSAFQIQYTKSHEQLSSVVEQTRLRVEHMEAAIGGIMPVVSKTDTIQQKIEDQGKDLEKEIKIREQDIATEINARNCDKKDLDDKITALTKSIGELKESVQPLIIANRIAVWVYSAVGLAVISLIIGIVSGKIKLLFY